MDKTTGCPHGFRDPVICPRCDPTAYERARPQAERIAQEAMKRRPETTGSSISFGKQGQVRRGPIRIGWIDDTPVRPGRWRLRFTPASGMSGVVGRYDLLKDAKAAARAMSERQEQEP